MGWADITLSARMLVWRVVLPFAKRFVPLPKLVSAMALPSRAVRRQPLREQRIIAMAGRVCGVGTWTATNCLERSLVAYRFLSEAGAAPRLVVGFRKEGAAVAGHVWVEVDGRAVGEPAPQMQGFAPTTVFSPDE